MALVCLLYFRAVQCNIIIVMRIPGAHNNAPDVLSHLRMTKFYPLIPQAKQAFPSLFGLLNHSPTPSTIPSSWSCHLNLILIAFQYSCTQHTCSPQPALSLTFVLANHRICHTNLKVYLSGIHLWYIEEGFS